MQESSSKWEIYSNTALPLTSGNIKKKKKHPQINNLALHLKQTEKEQQQQKNPQS